MKLAAIHHVAIIVSDYEKAREFYVNKLGFAVERKLPQGAERLETGFACR